MMLILIRILLYVYVLFLVHEQTQSVWLVAMLSLLLLHAEVVTYLMGQINKASVATLAEMRKIRMLVQNKESIQAADTVLAEKDKEIQDWKNRAFSLLEELDEKDKP
jgi:uncharacterized membrane protein